MFGRVAMIVVLAGGQLSGNYAAPIPMEAQIKEASLSAVVIWERSRTCVWGEIETLCATARVEVCIGGAGCQSGMPIDVVLDQGISEDGVLNPDLCSRYIVMLTELHDGKRSLLYGVRSTFRLDSSVC
jgi:hypothetical protein